MSFPARISSPTGRFVVITGADGSGKTTLLNALRTDGFSTACWQDACTITLRDGSTLETHISTVHLAKFRAHSRTLEVARVLMFFYEHVILPMLEVGHDVLVDSYHYRICAREHALNPAGNALLAAICATLPRPTHVIQLHGDYAVTYARNYPGHLSDYLDPNERSLESYAAQQAIYECFVTERFLSDLPVTSLDCTLSPAALLDETRALLAMLRLRPCLIALPT